MKKAERLLDLVAFFLNQTNPVSFEEIQSCFPEDYAGQSRSAALRKFERDKADLVQLGLPLKYLEDHENEHMGYFIDRESYALPDVALSPDELAFMYMAATAVLDMQASPFSLDLSRALNKMIFAANRQKDSHLLSRCVSNDNSPRNPGGLENQYCMQQLRQAVFSRKTVEVRYYSPWKNETTQRSVDPYGLACLRGDWFMVGFCRLRQSVRVFQVNRISRIEVNPKRPNTADFEVPSSFLISDYLAKHPWQIRVHEPCRAVVRIEPPAADSVQAELGLTSDEVCQEGNAVILTLRVTNLDGLVPTIMWYRDRARVIEPGALIGKVVSAWKRLESPPA